MHVIYYRSPKSPNRIVIDISSTRNNLALYYRKYLGTEDIYNISKSDYNYPEYKSSFVFGTKFLFEKV